MALATVVWSLVCAVTFVFARETRSADYRTFSKHLLGPWGLSGSDFDRIPDAPRGLEGVDRRPAILVELAHRGWSDEDLAKVAGGDILRVVRDAEQVATRLQGT